MPKPANQQQQPTEAAAEPHKVNQVMELEALIKDLRVDVIAQLSGEQSLSQM